MPALSSDLNFILRDLCLKKGPLRELRWHSGFKDEFWAVVSAVLELIPMSCFQILKVA